jgi:hypothetical protein
VLVEAPLSLVEPEVVPDVAVLRSARRHLEDDARRRAVRRPAVTERQPGEVAHQPHAFTDAVVFDLGDRAVGVEHAGRSKGVGQELRRRLLRRRRDECVGASRERNRGHVDAP